MKQKTQHIEGLTDKQCRALEYLMTEPTLQDVARKTGVSRSQLYRWMTEDPVFVAAYRRAKGEALDRTLTRLSGISGRAVDVIAEVMDDPATPANVRLAAATKAIELQLKIREVADHEERLAELEDKLAAVQQNQPRRSYL